MDDFKETGWDHISGDKTATFSTSEKKWIKLTRDKVFTVRLYRKRNDGFSAIVELAEEPKWLFWYGDLVLVQNGG